MNNQQTERNNKTASELQIEIVKGQIQYCESMIDSFTRQKVLRQQLLETFESLQKEVL